MYTYAHDGLPPDLDLADSDLALAACVLGLFIT